MKRKTSKCCFVILVYLRPKNNDKVGNIENMNAYKNVCFKYGVI